MASNKASIAVARGDGIGPEIMDATLKILKESGAALDIHEVTIGEEVYLKGIKTGIEPETWDVLRDTEAFLKAPITTPQGGGFKSLNVTIRGAFSLYANVRPCASYHPIVESKHPEMDVVVVRENEEGLYSGIEYQNTPDAVEALKIVTRSGCERIIRYAFEYAQANERKKVTCFTKDNILKLSDGLFHKMFVEIAEEYPDIENEHWIIDIGAAKLADTPEKFDVLVMPNLYGDILSDVAAQIAGSVGLAGSANIGKSQAMFEAIHGSAPRRAGQNLANPSGIILAAIMMLNHLKQGETASLIQNAWLKTLEDGIHTYDIFREGKSAEKVGTKEFGEAVVERLGKKPEKLKPAKPQKPVSPKPLRPIPQTKKELAGVDIYILWDKSVDDLQRLMENLAGSDFDFTLATNRGAKMWPDPMPETFTVDHWRCRFKAKQNVATHRQIIDLQNRMTEANVDFMQTIHLHNYDGEPAYSQSEY
jgi:isocitrate dehydrogenase